MAVAIASSLVWVSPRLFSTVSLLFGSDSILKAINTKTKLTWKPEYQEKNHDIVFIIF